MKNKIGVMQGRLLPKYQGRYQALAYIIPHVKEVDVTEDFSYLLY